MSTIELHPDNDFADLLDVVYSGEGPMASPQGVMGPAMSNCIELEARLVTLRRDLAISGAMRWPWSQEAPIHTRLVIRVG